MLTRVVFTLVARRNTSTSEASLVLVLGGVGVGEDSQFPPGPQQSGADQQQQDGREYLGQVSGVCQRGEERRRVLRPPAPTPWLRPHP